MIFLFSFYTNLRAFAELDTEESNGLVERHVHYHEEVLPQHARIIESRGLQPPHEAVIVRPVDGRIVADGAPEPAEHSVMGVYLVDCRDRDHAVELASMYPMPEGLGYIEVRPVTQRWDYAPSRDADVAPGAVWALYRDPSTWPDWKYGVQGVDLDGPVAEGAEGLITVASGEALPIRITEVSEGEGYTSETELAEGVTLVMRHRVTPLADGRSRITHQVTMPRSALDARGMDFSPRFNEGMQWTLDTLVERAATLQTGQGTP